MKPFSITIAILALALVTSAAWTNPPVSLAADPTPTLSTDCGTGAAIDGSETAGKVALGTDASNKCTLSVTTQLACVGTEETNCGLGHAVAVGIVTTPTSAQMQFVNTGCDGDVVSYVCNPF